MTDEQKALAALAALAETCAAAKLALDAAPTPRADVPPLAVLRKDYLALLTLLYTNTTKASLVLRPSAPVPRAALAPLAELAKHVSALTTCATLFDAHGRTLAADARRHAADLVAHVRAFAEALQAQDDPASTAFLVRTGAVHDAVEQIRAQLPTDNRAAVQRRLAGDREMLADCLEEVQEMAKEGAGEEDEDEDDWGDEDGLDELGLGASKPLSDAERLRAKRCGELMKCTCMLHKKILRDLQSQVFKDAANPILDALPSHSHELLLASEDLVASLYAPQKPATVLRAVKSIDDRFQDFKRTLFATTSTSTAVEDLAQKMSKASISEASPSQSTAELPHGYDISYRVLASCITKASDEGPPSQ
ncbi:hypothetical protein PsYK624_070470 [Phanerochaete sordida]|uniref:Uncharacterized protein n=1 Tax=Phanerochaete sordida TaxID=48140 RepID=A0A9P3G9W9_9APHY|nr:hypothetical protein PsYK624_070470 [Phanerochaete sordida]